MKIYKFPNEYEKKSTQYQVCCDDQPIDVYSCDVSAVPFNQVWPGYQRPKNQTEESAYVMFSSNDSVSLEIEPKGSFNKVTVRPLSKNIQTDIIGGKVKVSFPGCGQYTVEFDDSHHTLHVFINLEKELLANAQDEDVLYFAPGVHYLKERLSLQDGQTVLIDEGAVLYGAIEAIDKKDIKIIGYGIIDNSYMERGDEINGCAALAPDTDIDLGNPIFLNRCQNVLIEGVTIVNSSGWSIFLDGCSNVTVDNIKLIGMWRYNADGCDFCNCTNSRIQNSFLRNFDDCIVVKGFKLNNHLPVENILAQNCVLWCDWGRNLEVGAETSAPYMKNIVFRDCDIIHGCHVMMDIQHGDKAAVSDVHFEDIRIEYQSEADCPMLQENCEMVYHNADSSHMPILFEVIAGSTMWSIDEQSGMLKDVYFKNITVTTEDGRLPINPKVFIRDGENKIDGVFIENIIVNGEKQDATSLKLTVDAAVKNVAWK